LRRFEVDAVGVSDISASGHPMTAMFHGTSARTVLADKTFHAGSLLVELADVVEGAEVRAGRGGDRPGNLTEGARR